MAVVHFNETLHQRIIVVASIKIMKGFEAVQVSYTNSSREEGIYE
jgi:hypothetical protein